MVIRSSATSPSSGQNSGTSPVPVSVLDASASSAHMTSSSEQSKTGGQRYMPHSDDLIDIGETRQQPRRDSDLSSHGTWNSEEFEEDLAEGDDDALAQNIAESGPNGDSSRHVDHEIPTILKPGTSRTSTFHHDSREPQYESTQQPVQTTYNNPYHRQNVVRSQVPESEASDIASTSYDTAFANQPSTEDPLPPAYPPPPPPSFLPTDAQQSLSQPSKPTIPSIQVDPQPEQAQHAEMRLETPYQPTKRHDELPANNPWRSAINKNPGSVVLPNLHLENQSQLDIDFDKIALNAMSPTSGSVQRAVDGEPLTGSERTQSIPSAMHPYDARVAKEQATALSASNTNPEAQQTLRENSARITDTRQRTEHYQIKRINWSYEAQNSVHGHDQTLRSSPILIQNANGPCPLLALVNALILSTPRDVETALTEALGSRERISLGFLLDAVFDELTSGRRGNGANDLPDVEELYAFLLALHTGMNVNPCFAQLDSDQDQPGHAAARSSSYGKKKQTSFFEGTRELELYGTFKVPLIHGWLEPTNSTTYRAFKRSGPTFEDAQSILCVEAELEAKKQADGLSSNEQQTLHDIYSIRGFFDNWPTQLTEYGLERIWESLGPGQFAILFRNDHFSTLYKEPKHGALMTLVTDAGYASHDEIIWESLVDINGGASEYFSGDFRPISHNTVNKIPPGPSIETVKGRISESPHAKPGAAMNVANNRPSLKATHYSDSPSGLSEEVRRTSEQEDHDLALALQIQEEEEDRQRQTNARRQREQELSERFLSSEEQQPQLPPRRNTSVAVNPTQNTTPRRSGVERPSDNHDPDAPPSYQQSASDRLYRPAGSTAASMQGNPLAFYDALRRQSTQAQQSTTSLNSAHQRRRSDTNRIRRRSSQMGTVAPRDGYPLTADPMGEAPVYPGRSQQEERCTLM